MSNSHCKMKADCLDLPDHAWLPVVVVRETGADEKNAVLSHHSPQPCTVPLSRDTPRYPCSGNGVALALLGRMLPGAYRGYRTTGRRLRSAIYQKADVCDTLELVMPSIHTPAAFYPSDWVQIAWVQRRRRHGNRLNWHRRYCSALPQAVSAVLARLASEPQGELHKC